MNCRKMDSQCSTEEHSPVGPSGISAYLLCPGKIRMEKGLKDTTSFAAAQGTVAHAIGESKLHGKRYPKLGTVIVEDGHDILVDEELIAAVKVYVGHIKDIKDSIGDDFEYTEGIEAKGFLGFVDIPEVHGTADYFLSVPFSTLYIRDYKHGSGVMVDADNNPQLMAYALIAAQDMIETYEKVNIGIVQPRTREGAAIKVWETTPDVLLDWAENTLKPAVDLALSDDAPLNPGDKQCQWCKAQGSCPALAKQALLVAQEDFADFADIRPDQMVDSVSIEKVAQVYEQIGLLKKFIKAVEARVFNELALGNKVNGYKLVNGRKSRAWANEVKAVGGLKKLGIDPYSMKMISPAQAEKLLDKAGKKEVQGLISVSEGKPSIVKNTDKRKAITTAVDDFAAYAN